MKYTLSEVFFGVLLFVLLLALMYLANGLALVVLWGWFVTPMFSTIELTLPVAMGITLVVGFLTHQNTGDDIQGDKFKWLVTAVIKAFLKPALYIAIGYVITLFM